MSREDGDDDSAPGLSRHPVGEFFPLEEFADDLERYLAFEDLLAAA